jgi:hypothetical protein
MLKVWPMIHLAYILFLLSCFHCVCFPSFFLCVVLVYLAFSSCLISGVFNIFLRQFAFFFRVSIKNGISSHREQSDVKFRKLKPISWVFFSAATATVQVCFCSPSTFPQCCRPNSCTYLIMEEFFLLPVHRIPCPKTSPMVSQLCHSC